MNWHASTAANAVLLEVAEPGLESKTVLALGDPEGNWLCVFCHQQVASDRDRFSFDGKYEFTFSNPAGVRFDIITFSETRGCRQTGQPTLEHTWFPGHAWSYCQCASCGQHLGWYFTGQHTFAGLIKQRIIRALHVRN